MDRSEALLKIDMNQNANDHAKSLVSSLDPSDFKLFRKYRVRVTGCPPGRRQLRVASVTRPLSCTCPASRLPALRCFAAKVCCGDKCITAAAFTAPSISTGHSISGRLSPRLHHSPGADTFSENAIIRAPAQVKLSRQDIRDISILPNALLPIVKLSQEQYHGPNPILLRR